ncbi:MAG: hypothetical protein V4707_10380 [Pseudomonadota bacterium]
MISLAFAALLTSGQVAPGTSQENRCAQIWFLGFSASRATVLSGQTRWEGWLDDYDPSTDISLAFRVCPTTDRIAFSTASGDVTVEIPPGMDEAYIVVDARDVSASRARTEAPLLD